MNARLIKLEKVYWKIGGIIAVLFTLVNYHMWTEPFNIIKAVMMILASSIEFFVAINIIDLLAGVVSGIISYIGRVIKNRRLLKWFYSASNND